MILQALSLGKVYRTSGGGELRALDNVTLQVERGSFTVIAGPSGSGKSTLLALLGALERPTSGHVLYDGKSLDDCSDVELARVRRCMGFVFQDFSLIPGLTVEENITYPLIPRPISAAERRHRARRMLERLGLADRHDARARELSGGEAQRVSVARALAAEPEVIFADEPTSNLDVESASTIHSLLDEYRRRGATLVVSSHDQQIATLATHVHRLERGRLM